MERPYRTFRRIRCGWLAALLVAAPLAAQVHLTHLGTYATGSYDAGAAEVATYHAGAQRIYFTNADANTVVALNAADPAQPAALFTIDMTPYGAGVNSVTALADGIAVAVEAAPKTDPGAVVFFDVDGNFLSQVTVGALPDMVTVTPDGTKVLVANEGEPNDDYTIDPVGSVSIIDITGGTAALTQAQVVTLDFSGYTADMLPGVRLFGPGATVAQDMEPEHIAVSPDSQKAFVVCQENNAVARIDLATLTIEHVAALGMKDHGLPGNGLDASNQDNAINIANWPVKGYYMPDGMRAYAVGGQTYVVYANEGDAREWGDFIEPVRIGHASYPLDPAVFPDAETLKQNNNLGRLNATRHGGDINGDGLYEEIHVFGARSFSIRDADGALVYDSGDDFEQITAMAFPADFNSNNDENDSFDSRSDDKGPEPEAIELAEIDGRHYAFIGLERIGGIMVYDITDPAAPTFVQYVNNRDFSGDAEAGTAGDLGVEDITFVSAADSPDGEAFIITANEISGTVSIFRVGPPPPPAQLAVWTYEPVQGTTAAPLANIGTGTSALVGSMTGATTATGSTTGCAQAGGTTAWQIGTADPGTADQSSGVEFRTSTAGHADITFSYDHRISNSGTRTARIQYTLNGTDWTDMELGPDNYTSGCADRGGLDLGRIDASDPVGNNVSDSWGRRTIDFSAVEGANDNPDFGVRILAAHYGTTGQFRQANNVNNVATAGTWRLDNVSFTGHFTGAPPEPATHLAFVGLPATGATGIPVSGFTVEVRRADESVAQEFTGAVSIDLGSGTGGISGTLTQNIVAGIATFSDISFDEAGEKTLTATAGGLTGTSGTITITVAPAQLAVWTYEPVQGTTAAPLANIGTGTSALVGSMTGATTATGSTTGCAQAGGTTAWQIGTANPGTADQSSGVEFRTSTAGHADITFSYDHRISNSGTRTARIQYTLNGTDWTDMELGPDNYTSGCADRGGLDLGRIDASDPVGNNVSDSWGRRTIDFSAVEGANDNPDFGVRILAAHYGTTGQFRQANNVNNVATAGTWRLDNVSFTGQAMEEPAAFTLQILHASDFESPVSAIEAAPNFAAIVDHLEETHANTLTLSSGDNFLPSPVMFSGEDPTLTDPLKAAYEHYYGGPFANNDLRAGIGRADITIMNILGIRAAALGNHEFDLGTNELRNIIGGVNSGSAIRWFGAQFPYLSSNLDFSGDAGLAGLFTAEREEPAFFQSHPAMTAAEIAATPKLAPSTIIHVNDERIGVVGVTTPLLQAISSPGATTLIGPTTNDMAALAAVVQPVIDDLRDIEGIDKIVLLAHLQQIDMEKALAQLLSGVDVIIAGGSNTLMADDTDRLHDGDVAAEAYPFLTTDLDGSPVAIVNTDGDYKYVGRLVVAFDENGHIIPASIDPAVSGAYPTDDLGVEEVWGSYEAAFTPGSKGQEVRDLMNAVEAVIIAKDGDIYGRTSVYLEGRRNFVRTEETNLGDLSADANLWAARQYDPAVAVSIKNGGGIRSSIGSVQAVGGDVVYGPPAANPVAGKETGDISRLDIENSLRFNNLLTTLNLTAAGLHQVLEHGVAASGPGQTQGRYPQVSGVRFSYDQTLAPGARLLNAIIVDENDITLDTLVHEGMLHGDPGRVFRVVTLNFLSTGGDGYPFSTLGWDLVDLPTLPDAGPQQANFAVAGSEQDAFAEYIRHFHSAPGAEYAMAETPASEDHRIQEVNHRTDCILPPLYYADVDGDGYGDPNVFVTNCPGGAPDGHVTDNTDDCPLIAGRAGDSCDDGDPNTINDLITADCNCVGTPVGDCTNDLTIEFVTDANGTEIAWAIEPLAGGDALCGGEGLPSNAVVTADCCLPDGCYRLVVTDAGGDGIAGGGYVLRTADGERIIDNTGNFSTGSVSSVANGFCLPLGDDRPISTSCDRTWWQSGNYLVAAGNPAVSAEFGVSNATSGYEFWFYDPNGGLSFRKFRNHATSDGFAPNNAMRAAHIKLNNWAAANHLQDNVLYNVRIRGVVDGTELPYGPACRVVLDPVAAACTPTGLNDIAGHPNFSCGVSRTWGGPNSMANRLYARSVGGANKYQFEFSNADEGYLAVVQSNTVIRHLNWSSQPALNVGSTYQVRVRASKDGGTTWCNWGWACEVTIAPGVAPGGENLAMARTGVSLWPNPNNGQQLWMEVAGLTDDVRTIAIDIHDLSGKRVIAREVKAQHGAMNMDLDGLAAGTYVVAITAGDQRFVERLVIAD